MTDAQREYMLRQQLKAIQSELGEGEGEAAEIRRRVIDAQLPEPVDEPLRFAKSIGSSG